MRAERYGFDPADRGIEIEHLVSRDDYQQLLDGLARHHPALGEYQTWLEAADFVRNLRRPDPARDIIVRPIFLARREDDDPRWCAILLAVLWNDLIAAFHRMAWCDRNPLRRWSAAYWGFLAAADRLDPTRRRERLSQKLFNDTLAAIRAEYRLERCWSGAERIEWSGKRADELVGAGPDRGVEAFEDRDERETLALYLAALAARDRISEADYLLLLGTFIYDQPLAEYAREHGLDYETAKKRRQRVAARIGWGAKNFARK